jgi:hypothetical protein
MFLSEVMGSLVNWLRKSLNVWIRLQRELPRVECSILKISGMLVTLANWACFEYSGHMSSLPFRHSTCSSFSPNYSSIGSSLRAMLCGEDRDFKLHNFKKLKNSYYKNFITKYSLGPNLRCSLLHFPESAPLLGTHSHSGHSACTWSIVRFGSARCIAHPLQVFGSSHPMLSALLGSK